MLQRICSPKTKVYLEPIEVLRKDEGLFNSELSLNSDNLRHDDSDNSIFVIGEITLSDWSSSHFWMDVQIEYASNAPNEKLRQIHGLTKEGSP